MSPEEIATVLRETALPNPIELYKIQGKTVFELRNDKGEKAPGRIAYLYTRFPHTKFSLMFPDNSELEQVEAIIAQGIKDYQKKLEGPIF